MRTKTRVPSDVSEDRIKQAIPCLYKKRADIWRIKRIKVTFCTVFILLLTLTNGNFLHRKVVGLFCVTKSWKMLIQFDSLFDLVSILEYIIHYSSNLLCDVEVVGHAKNTQFANKFKGLRNLEQICCRQ